MTRSITACFLPPYGMSGSVHTLAIFCSCMLNTKRAMKLDNVANLKEYYEIVGESRPLSGFVPTHADLFTEMHF